MSKQLAPKLWSWATDLEGDAIRQAERTARLSVVEGHVALMPDAHLGLGATVGSVIPTESAVIPAAVGVDLGCGMIAVETDLAAKNLPDDLGGLLKRVAQTVPAGMGKGHDTRSQHSHSWFAKFPPPNALGDSDTKRALSQFGTLGAGNHFVEVCLDERDCVWIVLHSGSRGVGNKLAQRHIGIAKKLAQKAMLELEDPDLAYFVQGTAEFDAYIDDMLWAQDYALGNREQMMNTVLRELVHAVGHGRELRRINCHHNFCDREMHHGKELWITRKGAIRADVGRMGVIPGSMGAATYIVEGLGNPLSWNSCAHGAGRRMSRTQAKKRFTEKDLRDQMGDRTWQADKARALIDEIPTAYKDIDVVMRNQKDLVKVHHTLHQILNYKGT